jgi:hypothetical protein
LFATGRRATYSISPRLMPMSLSSWSESFDNSLAASRYRRRAFSFSEIVLREIIFSFLFCSQQAVCLLHYEMRASPRSGRFVIGSPDMRFSHCLLPPNVRGHSRQNQKIVESSLFGRFSQQESQKYCFVNSSWVLMQRRKHKVVRNLNRRALRPTPKRTISTNIKDRGICIDALGLRPLARPSERQAKRDRRPRFQGPALSSRRLFRRPETGGR